MTMTNDEVDRYLALNLMRWTQCECCSGYWTTVDSEGKPTADADFKTGFNPSRETEQALGDGGEGTVVGVMTMQPWGSKAPTV